MTLSKPKMMLAVYPIRVTRRVRNVVREIAQRNGWTLSQVIDSMIEDYSTCEYMRKNAAGSPTCPECERPMGEHGCTHCQQKGI